MSWEALATSTLLVTLAEIGDKTQLLSFVLAARLRRPGAIMAGILVATLANHALAGYLGRFLGGLLTPDLLRWSVGGLFIAFGLWTLKPDTLDETPEFSGHGAFVTTTLAFFLAEMGDKTQFATIALGARFDDLLMVVTGTTLGMMAANIPAVIIGEKLAARLPLDTIRYVAAGVFIVTGLVTLLA